ncbi:MAG: virulence associated protein, partial [Labilithrix sp.]|nr:virulence associated protein [Labilithrix sp.]
AGFDIEAPNAAAAPAGAPAASSIGMLVRATNNLEITNVSIRAGKGQDGVDGIEPANGNAEQSSDADGEASGGPLKKQCSFVGQLYTCNFDGFIGSRPAATGGNDGGSSQCRVGPNGGSGGRGGAGRISDNGVFRPGYNPADAQGSPAPTTVDTTGAVGPNGEHGRWSFNETGYVPGDGTPGKNGFPGKGGDGGYGVSTYFRGDIEYTPMDGTWRNGVGGGGGAGGCGGLVGTAGKGGGASIALLVVNSEKLSISKSRIEATEGGRAGKGTLGTLGTPGRAGGPKAAGDFTGGAGTRGVDGGAAGLSGHGAPGASIALAFKGARPNMSEVDLVSGTPGTGAPALTRGTQSLPAVAGEAKSEHSF